jgi:hypothetical protein
VENWQARESVDVVRQPQAVGSEAAKPDQHVQQETVETREHVDGVVVLPVNVSPRVLPTMLLIVLPL